MFTLSLQKDEPDAFKELGTGNRIATWLFYVSKLPINVHHTLAKPPSAVIVIFKILVKVLKSPKILIIS